MGEVKDTLRWGKVPLQDNAPKVAYHVRTSEQPLPRQHRRVVSSTPAGRAPERYTNEHGRMETDIIGNYKPPVGTQPRMRDAGKFDAMGQSRGWLPNHPNVNGSQRAVYDPVSHKTTMYSFSQQPGGATSVSREEGKGDAMLLAKRQSDLDGGVPWHGRRKGVVEFVDRTHSFAVNQNDEFLKTCHSNEHAYHSKKGALTHWMDNAIFTQMKPLPFKGK